jgi:hypothetical protein
MTARTVPSLVANPLPHHRGDGVVVMADEGAALSLLVHPGKGWRAGLGADCTAVCQAVALRRRLAMTLEPGLEAASGTP